MLVARIANSEFGGFADGWSERMRTNPDSEQIEPSVAKQLWRNSVSVEQIQDKPRRSLTRSTQDSLVVLKNVEQTQDNPCNSYYLQEKIF